MAGSLGGASLTLLKRPALLFRHKVFFHYFNFFRIKVWFKLLYAS